MSTVRPNCLRPMLSRSAYREFALQINSLVSWEQFGYEMMLFYIVTFIAPPMSALFMVRVVIDIFYSSFL